MLSRNNEEMRRRLRVEITNNYTTVVLRYKFAGNFSGDNFTE